MHAQYGIRTLRNIAITLRWSNDGQLGMPATDTITSSVTDMLQTLTWPSLQQRRLKTKLIMFYKIVHHIVAVPTTMLIPTDPRIKTISSIYIQTSSCIQRSVQVLILSEHNHSLEFTTSNYSSMPNSQHV